MARIMRDEAGSLPGDGSQSGGRSAGRSVARRRAIAMNPGGGGCLPPGEENRPALPCPAPSGPGRVGGKGAHLAHSERRVPAQDRVEPSVQDQPIRHVERRGGRGIGPARILARGCASPDHDSEGAGRDEGPPGPVRGQPCPADRSWMHAPGPPRGDRPRPPFLGARCRRGVRGASGSDAAPGRGGLRPRARRPTWSGRLCSAPGMGWRAHRGHGIESGGSGQERHGQRGRETGRPNRGVQLSLHVITIYMAASRRRRSRNVEGHARQGPWVRPVARARGPEEGTES